MTDYYYIYMYYYIYYYARHVANSGVSRCQTQVQHTRTAAAAAAAHTHRSQEVRKHDEAVEADVVVTEPQAARLQQRVV